MRNFQTSLFLIGISFLLAACNRTVESELFETEIASSVVDTTQVTPLEERVFTDISVGDKDLNVEIVDTAVKITLGLSYRDEIGTDGMLFIMPRRSQPQFWMRGMKFPLDMIWIDCVSIGDCAVANITKDVPVPLEPDNLPSLPTYSPQVSITHVLEVPAGWSEEHQIKIGDRVEL